MKDNKKIKDLSGKLKYSAFWCCLALTDKRGEKEKEVNMEEKKRRRYWVNSPKDGVYFTKREAITAILFAQGKTNKEAALIQKISHRTIEVYAYAMKNKLNCRTKKELVSVIKKSAFYRRLNKEERRSLERKNTTNIFSHKL